MNVFLETLGCRLNEAELQGWSRAFRSNGHVVVDDPTRAELLVLNTCAVTSEATRKSQRAVRRLHRRNAAAQLVVTGCFAELEPAATASLEGVSLVVGNADKDRLVERIEAELDLQVSDREPSGATASTHLMDDPFPDGRTRAFIKVQDGCRHRCTFCVVTVARGAERSRSVSELVAEIRRLERSGVREVVLAGVHLGGYGSDIGEDLPTLVEAVLGETAVPRVRLSSLEPWNLSARFFDLWRDARLMPHLHLPLQSGNDAVLRRMGRRCSVAAFEGLVRDARARISGLTLTTDLIVGFPGETSEEWTQSLETVDRVGFGHVHVFPFSPRPGTAAARYPGRLDRASLRKRCDEAVVVATRSKHAHLDAFVGQTRSVLWEAAERHDDGQTIWPGYTDNYLRVTACEGIEGLELRNRITAAELLARGGDRLHARAACAR